jgi:hypothetical protein
LHHVTGIFSIHPESICPEPLETPLLSFPNPNNLEIWTAKARPRPGAGKGLLVMSMAAVLAFIIVR